MILLFFVDEKRNIRRAISQPVTPTLIIDFEGVIIQNSLHNKTINIRQINDFLRLVFFPVTSFGQFVGAEL